MENILTSFSGTITPWLLGTFLTLSLIALFAAIINWREMKRSPYFFQRLQAGKRLQTYLSTSALLFLITMGVTGYAWQTPQDQTPRMAILTHSKASSAEQEVANLSSLVETVEEEAATSAFQLEDTENPGQLIAVADQPFAAAYGSLPEEYDQFTPTAELNENSDLGVLTFSTDVTENYEAINPREIFAEGFYTLYATFSYDGLSDGMVWSWVWRHNGELLEGGNEVWQYGEEGPGYIYLNPEEGFDAGRYSLEVWVNGELMTQSSAVMNSVGVSTNN
ncbi:MAG: hypothetical protein JSV68_05045 [Anaerolineaceae bacterium]|nr:MAG: hypothetical protein JSV68_05045 [Anaerolineaceae bacterium]